VLPRCLEKDPARRYASVGELALALAEFAPARAQPSVERVAKITGAVRATRHASPRLDTPQPTPHHHPQAQYPMAPAASKGMSPATIILILLVAFIRLGAGGCIFCVCVGAANSGNSRRGALDFPASNDLDSNEASRRPFQPRAGWTSVARGEPHRPRHPAEQSAFLVRWGQKRSRTSAHIAHPG
jgi:hypothetical protein